MPDNQNINQEVVETNSALTSTAKRRLKDYRIAILTACAFVVGVIALVTAFAIGQNTRFNSTNSTQTDPIQASSLSSANNTESSNENTSINSQNITKPVASTTSKANTSKSGTQSVEMSYRVNSNEPIYKFNVTYPSNFGGVAEVQFPGEPFHPILIFGSQELDGTALRLNFIYESFHEGLEHLNEFTRISNPNHDGIYRGIVRGMNSEVDRSKQIYRSLFGTNVNCMGTMAKYCMSEYLLLAGFIEIVECESNGPVLGNTQIAWCDNIMSQIKIEKIR